jgi:hypothetical protein
MLSSYLLDTTLGLSIALSSTTQGPISVSAPAKPSEEEGALRGFAAIHPIDVHVHVLQGRSRISEDARTPEHETAEYPRDG